ncbi:hypothetical protein DFH08DRAFT_806964 [Mycena albidolilacea]|uniref:Novel STAND NTPase 1 domain-containing protein n=1 Tax=Mycena albidolilacea TaxID=1033008 RepID=A0AAD7A4X4_9AGAR|nr:hypothetical protein DFH08DRAFT_806964 [Mycena albidolilacea]
MFNDISEMKKTTIALHEQLLGVIQTLPDATSPRSEGSLPKIFYGWVSELDSIMKMLNQQPARMAILGGGGMGKTSLARAVLHHAITSVQFEHRFFVSAEAATTAVELAALIGLHVGLDSGKDLTKPVVQYFSRQELSLLVLDNLETVWEPLKSRGQVEGFLSLLTDIGHLALIILHLTDNMPLAVDLIAHLSDCEGPSNVLTQWETEKTALFFVGQDRKSNLDVSISLSLTSPRVTSDAKELLSLLSIFPDGLSDAELVQSNLRIPNILTCKATLLATSLAYQDGNKWLWSLMPMREHIQCFLPPSKDLTQSLHKHFNALLCSLLHIIPELIPPRRWMWFHGADYIQPLLSGLCDLELEIQFTTEVFKVYKYYHVLDAEQLITSTTSLFQHIDNDLLESCFYQAVGNHFLFRKSQSAQAMLFFQKALELSKLCDDRIIKAGSKCVSGSKSFSMIQLHRGREILRICGIHGGGLDQRMAGTQAEIHLLKSEYAQAKNIYTQVAETNTPDWNAEIDIEIGGDAETMHQKLNQVKNVFSNHKSPLGVLNS